MIPKTEYRKLRKLVQWKIEQQKEHCEFISLNSGMVEFMAKSTGIRVHASSNQLEKAIKAVFKDCGLVDDETGTGTFTRPEDVEKIHVFLRDTCGWRKS